MILTKDEYAESIKEGVVLIDFFATWCGPCKMLAPIIEQVEKEIGTKAKIFKMDIDQADDIPQSLGIMTIPTMIIFKNGEEKERMIGLRNQKQIVDAIEKQL